MDWLIKTEQDLNRIQKRIAKEIKETERHLAFLKRSSDDCWGNPNPEEEYEKYSILMGKFERKLELIENLEKSLSITQKDLSKFVEYAKQSQS